MYSITIQPCTLTISLLIIWPENINKELKDYKQKNTLALKIIE